MTQEISDPSRVFRLLGSDRLEPDQIISVSLLPYIITFFPLILLSPGNITLRSHVFTETLHVVFFLPRMQWTEIETCGGKKPTGRTWCPGWVCFYSEGSPGSGLLRGDLSFVWRTGLNKVCQFNTQAQWGDFVLFCPSWAGSLLSTFLLVPQNNKEFLCMYVCIYTQYIYISAVNVNACNFSFNALKVF